jgi:hypothetical protein
VRFTPSHARHRAPCEPPSWCRARPRPIRCRYGAPPRGTRAHVAAAATSLLGRHPNTVDGADEHPLLQPPERVSSCPVRREAGRGAQSTPRGSACASASRLPDPVTAERSPHGAEGGVGREIDPEPQIVHEAEVAHVSQEDPGLATGELARDALEFRSALFCTAWFSRGYSCRTRIAAWKANTKSRPRRPIARSPAGGGCARCADGFVAGKRSMDPGRQLFSPLRARATAVRTTGSASFDAAHEGLASRWVSNAGERERRARPEFPGSHRDRASSCR